MLNRPSSRRNSQTHGIELNLIPILDTMVTLIGFLLFTTSFMPLVSIESPIPQASSGESQEMKEKPLQLTLTLRDKDVEIWSPFSRIEPKAILNKVDGNPDTVAIHSTLLEIKKKFPKETTVIVVPKSNTYYDNIIALMDSVRTIEATDPSIYMKNEESGVDEPVKLLFPQVVFGNLLSGDT